MVRDAAKGSFEKEARGGAAFVDKSCNERGRYAWRGDRFAR